MGRRILFSCVLVGTLIAGCRHDERTPKPGTLFSHAHTFAAPSGEVVQLDAGTLYVEESRRNLTGAVIAIPYYRLRSTAQHPAAPVFVLAGGPGESAIDDFENDEIARAIALTLRESADVVLFDQRGAGRARPLLDCTQRVTWPAQGTMTQEAYGKALREQAIQCRDHWRRLGIDLAAYNTVENAADVDALRRALGYERVSLLGHSYGTHLALAVMRYHPQIVERAVLHGLEGPDQTYDLPSQTLAGLGAIAAAAERSAGLKPYIPAGGLLAALERIEQRLAESPVTVNVVSDGRANTVTLGTYEIQRLAREGAHDRGELSWPARIIEMDAGDFTRAAEATLEARRWPIDSAMLFMMDCASGLSAPRRKRLLDAAAERRAMQILGDLNISYFAACEPWESPDLGSGFRDTLQSNIPVLFIQGTWDISTPVSNVHEVAPGFRNGIPIAVKGGTHYTLHDLFDAWPDIRPLLRDFMSGRKVNPPPSIELPEPRFPLPRLPGTDRNAPPSGS